MRPQLGVLLPGELESKICGEPRFVPAHLLIQALCCDAVDRGKIGIKDYPLTSDREDERLNVCRQGTQFPL